ncbi:MAG: polyphosphate kinase 2 [Chloroflexi bacterium]|nr:polyphosphate kinase 2 [Chloroflexota bacterium]
MKRAAFEAELRELETELVQLQEWVKQRSLKVVVLFEGRDTAGKGGVIKRITARLNPRVVRTVALAAPTDRERSQYYLQRYVPHLPAAGEMVLFDRSWYNRAGVERVMGFASDAEVEAFLQLVPGFERTLVMSGIVVIKYWLDIDQATQEERFRARLVDPRRRWKLSSMDLEARRRWDDYTRARDEMLVRTSSEHAPWYVVDARDQRRARLALIRHLLATIPHEDLLKDQSRLPSVRPGRAAPLPVAPGVVQVPLGLATAEGGRDDVSDAVTPAPKPTQRRKDRRSGGHEDGGR